MNSQYDYSMSGGYFIRDEKLGGYWNGKTFSTTPHYVSCLKEAHALIGQMPKEVLAKFKHNNPLWFVVLEENYKGPLIGGLHAWNDVEARRAIQTLSAFITIKEEIATPSLLKLADEYFYTLVKLSAEEILI